MESLKKITVTRLQWLSMLMVVLILPVAVGLQIIARQNQARADAEAAFQQIGHVLEENIRELETMRTEYRETCLLNAEAIAYMIQYHPEILGDIEEFRRIARMIQVDEIHIFDKTGRIFTGTHPEYYDFTFESGEQIGFFAPLLEDKTLRLCQEITPNTAESKLVQYSALWSADGEFIVQVGMYPETVLEYTEKNELSYIFSLLKGAPGVSFYAIDGETGTIQGSPSGGDNGKHMEELGFQMADMGQYRQGSRVTVAGVDSFCVFTDMDGRLIGYVVAQDALYRSVWTYTILLAASLCLIVFIIVWQFWRITKKHIIRDIDRINHSLSLVADGNIQERVEVRSSVEFSELSDHINHMIQSVLTTGDKMSYVLDQTKLRIGAYEYNTKMKRVWFTERIPEILDWDTKTSQTLVKDCKLFQRYLERIRENPVAGEKNIYRLAGDKEVYVRMEEVVNGIDTLGILVDETEDILTKRNLERERDLDLLTEVYNRRGMEQQLDSIFAEADMTCGALVMIDADNLKTVNDVYGHVVGDQYLRRVAEVLSGVGTKKQMVARQGGDEFVLLLYGYSDEATVRQDLAAIRYAQKNTTMTLADGSRIPVEFSYGYVLTEGRRDYAAMLAEADSHMYNVKRIRREAKKAQT